jgi:hypothetical protein
MVVRRIPSRLVALVEIAPEMSAIVPIALAPPPGVVVTETLRTIEGRWTRPFDKIRFVKAKPQKIGGNIRVTATAMSGTPRALLAWRDFLQNQYVAAGTFRKLYAFDSSFTLNDITPFRLTSSGIGGGSVLTNPFTTQAGSSIVAVTHTSHGLNPGDQIIFTQATFTGNTHTSTTLDTLSADMRNLIAGAVITGTDIVSNPATTVASVGSATSLTLSQAATGTHSGNTYTATPGVGSGTGAFTVLAVNSPNSYTFDMGVVATVSTTGGGTVSYQYEIPVGVEIGVFGLGYGVGPYGLGTYGTPRQSSTIFIEPRVWSLDHFGVVLLATYNGGTLWSFDPTQPQPWPRAVGTFGGVAMNAPTDFRAMFITPERFVFGLCDKMVVKVCSQNDPTTWTPSTSNTAFQRTLQIGTKLVGGRVLAPFISMVWSDAAAYLFQYTGSQFVYNSSVAGLDCGLVAPGAAATVDGLAYWMGSDNFYWYNGNVSPMPNVEDIRKYVFDALPASLAYQCTAIYVPKYHEVWWFYPTTGASNPTNYVIYHINDQCWSVGTANFYSSASVTAGRASGSHFTQGDTSPLMAGTDGYIYNHDPVGDSFNDNSQPLTWILTIAPLAKSEGLQNLDVEGVLWDFFQQQGSISATINTFDRLTDLAPMDSETEVIPATQAGLTDYRVGGRYLGFTLTSSDPGNYMRYGKPVAFVRPSARRR